MSKKELLIPNPELIFVGEHPYSLQAIGEKLPIWNATKYAEAFDRVAASEKNTAMHEQEYHIREANRIAKYGRGLLAIGVFDNVTANPGHPDSLRGYVYAGLEKVKVNTDIAMADDRIITIISDEPSIYKGPLVAKEYKPNPKEDKVERLRSRDRFMLKMQLTRFAIKAFTAAHYGPFRSDIRVDINEQDYEGIEVFEAIQCRQAKRISETKKSSKGWEASYSHLLMNPYWLNDIFSEYI